MVKNNKKLIMPVLLVIFVSVVSVSAYKLTAENKYKTGTLSKSEIIEMTKVTDEEKTQLEKLGLSYEDILSNVRNDEKELFETYLLHDKDKKLLFLADGGMTTGLTEYNGILNKTVATYDAETDPNAVTYEEAIELWALKDARNEVNRQLGIPVDGE